MGSSPCRNYSLLNIAHPVVGPHSRYRTGTGGRRSIEASIVKKDGLWLWCENMDPDKWDTTVWYQVPRNPQEFHGLMGCQRDP